MVELLLIFLLLFCMFMYFIPMIIAFSKDKKQAVAISMLNLFLGWTILGWIIALIWAVAED